MTEKIPLLYVDDEPINLKIFELSFKNRFSVYTAQSGFEGIDVLKNNNHIRVVVSDMRMPRKNGIEFIRQAKDEFPSMIFFILTGYDITHEIAEALNQNLIYKYFSKPLNVTEIEKTIYEATNTDYV